MTAFDVHFATFPVSGGTPTGALGTIPVVGSAVWFKAPSDALGGGFTITEAQITAENGGLGTFSLYTSSAAGTKSINGTIVNAWGTSTMTAGSAYPMTIADGWVDGDEYIIVGKTGSLLYPGGLITIAYVMGH